METTDRMVNGHDK